MRPSHKVTIFSAKMQLLRFLSVLFLFSGLFCLNTEAQKKNRTYQAYIEKYSDMAVEQMKKYAVPASITLAQGILESGGGKSKLASESNNHFGIKCGSAWKGEKVYHTDDRPNECFRKYRRVSDSYEDHSVFLARQRRYADLFTLKITDYEGWAKGLQRCGYATSPKYASALIRIIEIYELYQFDNTSGAKKKKKKEKTTFTTPPNMRPTFISGGLLYVEAEQGDSFEKIAYDMGFKLKNLLKYNEVPDGFPLNKGDIVYLERKKVRADMPNLDYIVKIGDSMHGISQRFGIQVKSLYKMNKKDADYVPSEGDVLRLR